MGAQAPGKDFEMANYYSYPAIFREDIEDETDALTVVFPDIPGCISCGEDLEDAYAMSKDALRTMLKWYQSEGKAFPVPSPAKRLFVKKYESVHIITVDLDSEDDLVPPDEERVLAGVSNHG